MRRLAILAMLLLAGCTSVTATPIVVYVTPEPSPSSPEPTASPTPSATLVGHPTVPGPPTLRVTFISDLCVSTMQTLYVAEQAMDAKLDVGIVEADYQRELQDLSVAQNASNTEAIGQDEICLRQVALPLANALIDYADAGTLWNKCVTKISCTFASIRDKVQAKWADAHTLIAGVEAIWPR